MRADYDSQADALSIDLVEVDRWDAGDAIDDTYCHVAFRRGRLANVELLNPCGKLHLLDAVAQRYEIDPAILLAAAQAALAAPDRAIALDIAEGTTV